MYIQNSRIVLIVSGCYDLEFMLSREKPICGSSVKILFNRIAHLRDRPSHSGISQVLTPSWSVSFPTAIKKSQAPVHGIPMCHPFLHIRSRPLHHLLAIGGTPPVSAMSNPLRCIHQPPDIPHPYLTPSDHPALSPLTPPLNIDPATPPNHLP